MQVCQTADGSLTLLDPQSGQSYRSMNGAVTESTLVFLQNSSVAARLSAGMSTNVLEIGFGTGLNFGVTATLAAEQCCQLHYSACEFALPPVSTIQALWKHNLPHSMPMLNALIPVLRKLQNTDGCRTELGEFVELDLRLSDARTCRWPDDYFDAIYLDAFSASRNPALWQQAFLETLRPTLRQNGRLATFGVNRAFRLALEGAGFDWEKKSGPPGKREVLVAHRQT
jgi:tRNA U34 5-methylaminomethyl-2-thiouridine-forming methyltransferase MnmC